MASIEYVVKATDAASRVFEKIGLSADGLDKQLGDLSKRVATPEVDLKDAKFTAGIIRAAERIDKLSGKIADPKIEVDTRQAQTEILRISAMLDRLDAKRVKVDVGISRRTAGGFFKGLVSSSAMSAFFSGGGSGGSAAAAGAAPAAGPVADFLGSPAGIGTVAAGAPFISALVDAITGFGLGSGVAGAGALGAFKAQPGAFKPGLSMIKTSLDNVFKSIAPTLGMMTASLGRFVQLEQGPLAKLFGASLPFAQAWLKIMEQAAKTIIPALTQVLNAMVSSGALKAMTQGFVFVTQGIAALITHLGPGFKAGAEIFRAVSLGIKGVLIGVGMAFGTLGNVAGHEMTYIHDKWDWLRHATANVFDGMRHDLSQLGHDVLAILNGLSRAAGSAWHILWDGIKTATLDGIKSQVGWFGDLPRKLIGAIWGLGHTLASFMRSAFSEMWAAMKNVGATIISWAKSWVSDLWHGLLNFMHMSPPHPGSLFYDLGASMMHHLEAGIKSRAGTVAGTIGGAIGGAIGPGISGVQSIAIQMARAYGWGNQWGAINAIAMRESGWSMTAQNKSSGAYGIAQFINGPGEYYQYGGNPNTATGQITGFYNYIKSRYGTPLNAWQHELNFGWYDRGGWLPPGLSLALNNTGAPERVGGTGTVINVNVRVDGSANPAEVGRVIVDRIRQFEKRSGTGWRN